MSRENQTFSNAESISGNLLPEEQTSKLLSSSIAKARSAIGEVSRSFNQPWSANPSTGVKKVLGFWVVKSTRHLAAIVALAESHDLAKVAEVHYRQMIEIMLQVRLLAGSKQNSRERMAQKISAWGCVDLLEKMDQFKGFKFAKKGYTEMQEQLARYDSDVLEEIRTQREKHHLYWFGNSFSKLASRVSRGSENLAQLYRVTSGELHGTWDIVLDVANPEPGHLDFRGYQNWAQLLYWAAEIVDRSAQLHVEIWNEVANAVGAPLITVSDEPNGFDAFNVPTDPTT